VSCSTTNARIPRIGGIVPPQMAAMLVVGLSFAAPLAAQRLPKPEFTRTPTVLVAPTYIWVSFNTSIVTPHLLVEFNAVANAVEYRVSRSPAGTSPAPLSTVMP